MTFANGNANFKYGALRPLEELDRTCIFYGRNACQLNLHSFPLSLANGFAPEQSYLR